MPKSFSWRASVLRIATQAQNISAATLGSVLIVHMAAPVVASFARGSVGLDMANQALLMGREYYQQALLEPVLVWGSLCVHLISSAIRRTILPRARVSWLEAARDAGWWQKVAGTLLVPVLAIHVCVNRLVPMQDSMPIMQLSPSELDMSHVSVGFARHPMIMWGIYTSLCVAGAAHIMGGAAKIARRRGMQTRISHGVLAGVGLAGMLLLGTYTIAKNGATGVSSLMQERIMACYREVWPYSVLRS